MNQKNAFGFVKPSTFQKVVIAQMKTLTKSKRIVNNSTLEEFRNKPCEVCKTGPKSDPHHIISKGAGGHDVESNLISLCRRHHSEIHQIGQEKFILKYPHTRIKLRPS